MYLFYTFLVLQNTSLPIGPIELPLNYLFIIGVFGAALSRNYWFVKSIPGYLKTNTYLLKYIAIYLGVILIMATYHLVLWGKLPTEFVKLHVFSLWGPGLAILLVPDWDIKKLTKSTIYCFFLSFLVVGPSAFLFYFNNRG
ncbi:MAG: hypothetical protein NXH75_15440, partial [Halobacteriovoraceae bacterium]|nr:hypothetical protein [Halobacteriovoraceae bacterium]